MQAVAETRHYAVSAEKLLTASERQAIVDTVALDPLKGDLITGTGGVRKLRFAKQGKGKSGGVRVIYYYYDESAPLLLLDLFGKMRKIISARQKEMHWPRW